MIVKPLFYSPSRKTIAYQVGTQNDRPVVILRSLVKGEGVLSEVSDSAIDSPQIVDAVLNNYPPDWRELRPKKKPQPKDS